MSRVSGTRRPIRNRCGALIAVATLMSGAAAAQDGLAIPRVRSDEPLIAQLLLDAPSASPTFRRLVQSIATTNGIVYVQSGHCVGAQACLPHRMHIAGPNRILRILVSTNRERAGLIGAIGHELQHAVEVLREPGITTGQGMFFQMLRMSMSTNGRFETKAAIEAGLDIEHELRR